MSEADDRWPRQMTGDRRTMAIYQALRFSALQRSQSHVSPLLNNDRYGYGANTLRAPGDQTFEIGKVIFTAS